MALAERYPPMVLSIAALVFSVSDSIAFESQQTFVGLRTYHGLWCWVSVCHGGGGVGDGGGGGVGDGPRAIVAELPGSR